MARTDLVNARVGKTIPRDYKNGIKLPGNPDKMVKHHVLPKHPDTNIRTITVDEQSEKCYHLLFGNAKSYKDACSILLRDWWTDRRGNFIK